MSTLYNTCPCESGNKFKFCCYQIIKEKNPRDVAHIAVKFPVHLCMPRIKQEEFSGVTAAFVARILPNGNFIVGSYVVDTLCLGVKDVDLKIDITQRELDDYSEKLSDNQDGNFGPVEYENLRSLILGAVDYAAQWNFHPHSDWNYTKYLLEPNRPYKKDVYEFGHDGKPFYIQGPFDDAATIMKQVQKKGGHWLVEL